MKKKKEKKEKRARGGALRNKNIYNMDRKELPAKSLKGVAKAKEGKSGGKWERTAMSNPAEGGKSCKSPRKPLQD